MKLLITLTNKALIEDLKKRGADGIIIGIKNYSDRMNHLFSISELDEILSAAKSLGLEVFINLNNVFSEKELDNIRILLFTLKDYEIDGILYNDMSILFAAKVLKMENMLIYHPDTLMTNSNDIKIIKNLGLKDIVLSKDITFDEIKEIVSKVGKVSMFIHGHLNLSYSKRKFLKNYFEFINDMRGYKKEKLYLKEESRDYKLPIKETGRGTAIFTDYVFNTFNEFKELKDLLNYAIIDDFYLEEDEILEVVSYYASIDLYMDNFDGAVYFTNKYPESNYSTGFLYRKTASKKELLDEKN